MRHFSDLSSPVVGESVSLLDETQQQQRRQHGGREGVSGGNKSSSDTEMYQNILVRDVGALSWLKHVGCTVLWYQLEGG